MNETKLLRMWLESQLKIEKATLETLAQGSSPDLYAYTFCKAKELQRQIAELREQEGKEEGKEEV